MKALFTNDSDPARTSTGFTVSGQVIGADGVPIPKLYLQASLDPSKKMIRKAVARATAEKPAGVAGFVLTDVVTDSAGRFSLNFPALRGIAEYVDDDGEVRILFMGGSADQKVRLTEMVSMVLPKHVGVRPEVAADATSALVTEVDQPGIKATQPLDSLRFTATRPGKIADRTARASTLEATTDDVCLPGSGCDLGYQGLCVDATGGDWSGAYEWRYYPYWERKYFEIGRVSTLSGATATYTWKDSHQTSTSMGLEFTFNGTFSTTGNMEVINGSNQQRVWSFGTNTSRIVELETRYQDAILFCYDNSPSPENSSPWVPTILAHVPYDHAGDRFTNSFDPDTWFTCSPVNLATYNSTLSVSRDKSTNTTFSVGAVLNMTGQQKHTTGYQVAYSPTIPSASYTLCGNDGVGITGTKVKEVGTGGGGGGGQLPSGHTRLDFSGDGNADILWRNSSNQNLYMLEGNGAGGWKTGTHIQVGDNRQDMDLPTTPGDFTGDGEPDLIFRKPSDNNLYLIPGNGAGGWKSQPYQIGVGWADTELLTSAGDFNGDNKPDLLFRKPSNKNLYLITGNGSGGWSTQPTQIGENWWDMDMLVATSDFSGDGKPDVIYRRASNQNLYMIRGNGNGGWATGASEQIGVDWNNMDMLLAPGDFSGDGMPDLVYRRASNKNLYMIQGNGNGGWITGASQQIGVNWSSANSIAGASIS